MTLGALSPERLKSASGLFNLMRNLGGAIGIAGCGTMLNDRANLHFLRRAEHLNTTNASLQGMLHQVEANLSSVVGGGLNTHAAALTKLRALTWREAQVQTYSVDAFLIVAVWLLIATLMVPLMQKITAPAAPSAEAH